MVLMGARKPENSRKMRQRISITAMTGPGFPIKLVSIIVIAATVEVKPVRIPKKIANAEAFDLMPKIQ